MQIENEQFEECATCGHRTRTDITTYVCDGCGKTLENDHPGWLNMTAFMKYKGEDNDNIHLDFCSWDCWANKIAHMDTSELDFVDFPLLSMRDDLAPGCTFADFLDAMRKFGVSE